MQKGTVVFSRDGKESGLTTGASHACRMEGCRGQRISVKWSDGKTTRPCSKGMDSQADGSMKIL